MHLDAFHGDRASVIACPNKTLDWSQLQPRRVLKATKMPSQNLQRRNLSPQKCQEPKGIRPLKEKPKARPLRSQRFQRHLQNQRYLRRKRQRRRERNITRLTMGRPKRAFLKSGLMNIYWWKKTNYLPNLVVVVRTANEKISSIWFRSDTVNFWQCKKHVHACSCWAKVRTRRSWTQSCLRSCMAGEFGESCCAGRNVW